LNASTAFLHQGAKDSLKKEFEKERKDVYAHTFSGTNSVIAIPKKHSVITILLVVNSGAGHKLSSLLC